MLDAGFPVGHHAQHAQGLAVTLGRQRLGDIDARDAAVLLDVEHGDHLALGLLTAGGIGILQRLGEPLHELDGTAGILRQVFDDVEVERVVRVYVQCCQRLVVVGLLQIGQQRLIVVALAFYRVVGGVQLHLVVDDAQLLALLGLLLLLNHHGGLHIRHRHQLALVHQIAQVQRVDIVGGGHGVPLQCHVERSQHEDEPQEESRGATLLDISLWRLLLFHCSAIKSDFLRF